MASKAWPYEEARKLLKRYPEGKPGGAPVVFETGYGPSGLPHLGTFTEVVRTSVEDAEYLVVQVWKPGEPVRTLRRT